MNNAFATQLREARNFSRSLLSEGYVFVLEYTDEHARVAFMKLRHKSNGNIIKVRVWRNEWSADKNNKQIKRVVIPE